MDGFDLSFERHGATRYDRVALSVLDGIQDVLAGAAANRAGVRLHGIAGLAPLLAADSPIGRLAAAQLGSTAKPVRAVLFDKTPETNWALGWHQDRTVAVRARHDLENWGPWSIKAGVQYVEPPFAIIDRMVTLRVHLDPVPSDNAPLLIAPGSHCFGRIRAEDVDAVVKRCGTAACLAERGDIWLYATPIVHASCASGGHAHRRVLQIDYSVDDLPMPLQWFAV